MRRIGLALMLGRIDIRATSESICHWPNDIVQGMRTVIAASGRLASPTRFLHVARRSIGGGGAELKQNDFSSRAPTWLRFTFMLLGSPMADHPNVEDQVEPRKR